MFKTESYPPLSPSQLKEYLNFIGCNHQHDNPSLENLNAILIGQATTIPFLRVISPGQLSIEPEQVFQRLVIDRRGGYCFHLNILLVRVLKALGYTVSNGVSRGAKWDPDDQQYSFIGPTHMVVFVQLGSVLYLADLGFNHVGLTQAIEITDGAEVDSVAGERHLIRSSNLTGDGNWILWHRRAPWAPQVEAAQANDDGFTPLLYFTLERFRPADYEVLNFYTSHAADFILARSFVASLVTRAGGRVVLTDTVLRTRGERGHEHTATRFASAAALGDALLAHFGVRLTREEAAAAHTRFFATD